MRDHARETVSLTQGRTRAELGADRLLNLAVVRLLEIVGEAATRVPPGIQDKYPAVPWQQIVGLRNRLAHGYDEVDLDLVWDIVTSDLPPLIAALELALDA
jgi:uncharacterized protein with HEPN domain